MNNAIKDFQEVAQIKELIKPAKREADAKEVASLCEGFTFSPMSCSPLFTSTEQDEDILF